MSALTFRFFPRCTRQVLMKLNRVKVGDCANTRNYWRRNVFTELSSAMQNVERNMREMDKVFDDFQRSSSLRMPRFFSPFDCNRRDIPVVSTDGTGQSYRLELNMEGMEPEDINVTLKDHQLEIKARKEEKRDDGSKYVREFQYSYSLPKEINPQAIVSRLSGGVLTIEAPLPALESKEIPIKVENSTTNSAEDVKK